MLDISILNDAVESTAPSKPTRKVGAVTLTRTQKNGYIRLPKTSLTPFQGAKSVGVSFNDQYLVIYAKEGRNSHELRVDSSGAGMIYNCDLVDEIVQRFALDLSAPATIHIGECEPIDGAKAVGIKVA